MSERVRILGQWLLGLALAGGLTFGLLRLDRLPLGVRLAGWAVLAGLLSYPLWRLMTRLCGPILFYDMVRGARNPRLPLLRIGYAILLLVVLFLVYLKWTPAHLARDPFAVLYLETTLPPGEIAAFASSFFMTFLGLQLVVVLLLTPALVGGAISGDKQTGALDFLLTSDLRSHEIILGKLGSRLATLLLLLLTGLPVLGFLQLLGGVDPNLVLAGFACTLLTLLSIGAVSIATSVMLPRPRDAVSTVYIMIVGYLMLTGMCCTPFSLSAAGRLGLLGWPSAGNFLTAWARFSEDPTALPEILRGYAIFHGVLTVVCLLIAIRQLRPRTYVYSAPARRRHGGGRRPVGPPPPRPWSAPRAGGRYRARRWIGDTAPMMWKELHGEFGIAIPPLLWAMLVIAGSSALGLMVLTFFCGVAMIRSGKEVSEFANIWMRICCGAMATVILLGIALRAAGTFTREKERQTLDSLLTTPLRDEEILLAKWMGCLWSVRVLGILLLLMYTAVVLTGGMCPFAVPLVALGALVHAAFTANLGMYISLRTTSTLRATALTIVALIGISAAAWVLGLFLSPFLIFFKSYRLNEGLQGLQIWGLIPPCNLSALGFYLEDFKEPHFLHQRLIPALAGIAIYALLTGLLWLGMRRRLHRETGRVAA